jgi:hypothetical protein
MHSVNSPRARWIAAGLAVLMAATRFHHEGTSLALPDASLAVFFLAGWYLRSLAAFAGFLLLAFLIDHLAITYAGVSGYCISPAYGFLVPTYGVMWWAGRRAGPAQHWNMALLRRALAALLVSTMVAFIVSSASFFLLSGKVAGVNWTEYGLGIAGDYPGYLTAAFLYCALTFGLELISRSRLSAELWHMKR